MIKFNKNEDLYIYRPMAKKNRPRQVLRWQSHDLI